MVNVPRLKAREICPALVGAIQAAITGHGVDGGAWVYVEAPDPKKKSKTPPLDPRQKCRMAFEYRTGTGPAELARRYGKTPSYVHRVIRMLAPLPNGDLGRLALNEDMTSAEARDALSNTLNRHTTVPTSDEEESSHEQEEETPRTE
jgi:hypothetical protein